MADLHPQHFSQQRPNRLRPRAMSMMAITPEHREVVESVCLDIFADMSNAGASLAETLSAVYMSGVRHTLETIRAA